MLTGIISNIQKFCIHDGKGIRTVVFFKGCPLKCLWCANPETQEPSFQLCYWQGKCLGCGRCINACPQQLGYKGFNREKCQRCFRCLVVCPTGALEQIGRKYTIEDVLSVVQRDAMFYEQSSGGVTISGGEPLAQHQFCFDLILKLKRYGFNVDIETCGYAATEIAQKVLVACDEIFYDIKHMDSDMHKKGTGVGNELIIRNLKEIALKCADKIIVRIPVIGGYNDDWENISQLKGLVKKLGIKEIHLLPYHEYAVSKYASLKRDYGFNGGVDPERVKLIRASFLDEGIGCVIGG